MSPKAMGAKIPMEPKAACEHANSQALWMSRAQGHAATYTKWAAKFPHKSTADGSLAATDVGGLSQVAWPLITCTTCKKATVLLCNV